MANKVGLWANSICLLETTQRSMLRRLQLYSGQLVMWLQRQTLVVDDVPYNLPAEFANRVLDDDDDEEPTQLR